MPLFYIYIYIYIQGNGLVRTVLTIHHMDLCGPSDLSRDPTFHSYHIKVREGNEMEEGNATVERAKSEEKPKNPNQKISSSSFPARSRRVWSLGLPSRRRLFRFHHRLLLLLFHPSSHATPSAEHHVLFHSDSWYQKSGILGFFVVFGDLGFMVCYRNKNARRTSRKRVCAFEIFAFFFHFTVMAIFN